MDRTTPPPDSPAGPRARLRIAVVGGGVAGLTAAWLLAPRHAVTLYEGRPRLGGHTHTVEIPDGPDAGTRVDTGFIVHNARNYPTILAGGANMGLIHGRFFKHESERPLGDLYVTMLKQYGIAVDSFAENAGEFSVILARA